MKNKHFFQCCQLFIICHLFLIFFTFLNFLRTSLRLINKEVFLYYHFKSFNVLCFMYKSSFFLELIFPLKQGFNLLFFHLDNHNLLNNPSFPHLSATPILFWIKFSCMSGSVYQFLISFIG